MNGSADCDQCSPMATDEEPPGPLDLTSSILSTDLTYSGESVSVDTAATRVAGFAPDVGTAVTPVATTATVVSGTIPFAGSSFRNGFAAVAPLDELTESATQETIRSRSCGNRPMRARGRSAAGIFRT